jgi:hypothetical protein
MRSSVDLSNEVIVRIAQRSSEKWEEKAHGTFLQLLWAQLQRRFNSERPDRMPFSSKPAYVILKKDFSILLLTDVKGL